MGNYIQQSYAVCLGAKVPAHLIFKYFGGKMNNHIQGFIDSLGPEYEGYANSIRELNSDLEELKEENKRLKEENEDLKMWIKENPRPSCRHPLDMD